MSSSIVAISQKKGALLVFQQLGIGPEGEVADNAFVSLFFQRFLAVRLYISRMHTRSFVGYVKALFDDGIFLSVSMQLISSAGMFSVRPTICSLIEKCVQQPS
jgi:hypothetical protein